MEIPVFCSKPYTFVPGIHTAQDIKAWAKGTLSITEEKEPPSLRFTTPLFRRRLGMLCKMVVHVVHEAVVHEGCTAQKQVFVTLRGDISRQYAVNKSIIEESHILPAAFSLSVFNAPIALANIALSLTGGYSVLIPSQTDFFSAIQAALAPVLCGDEESTLLVYGDQAVPEEYGALCPKENDAFAFAVLVAQKKSAQCPYTAQLSHAVCKSPKSFLHHLLCLETQQ